MIFVPHSRQNSRTKTTFHELVAQSARTREVTTNSLQRARQHHVSLFINQSGGKQPFRKQSQSDLIESLRVSVPP